MFREQSSAFGTSHSRPGMFPEAVLTALFPGLFSACRPACAKSPLHRGSPQMYPDLYLSSIPGYMDIFFAPLYSDYERTI
jgi:hypothetical protein